MPTPSCEWEQSLECVVSPRRLTQRFCSETQWASLLSQQETSASEHTARASARAVGSLGEKRCGSVFTSWKTMHLCVARLMPRHVPWHQPLRVSTCYLVSLVRPQGDSLYFPPEKRSVTSEYPNTPAGPLCWSADKLSARASLYRCSSGSDQGSERS